MAPSKKCFPLQPGAFFRFSRIFKLSQSAYTSNLPFSKMCFLPRRGTQFCFFPLLTISPKTCKSNLSAFPPFLSASWGLLGSPWNSLGPSWRQLCAKLGQLGANLGELLPNWGQLGPTCGQFCTNLCHPGPNLDTVNLKNHCFSFGFSMFLICRSSCNLGANL